MEIIKNKNIGMEDNILLCLFKNLQTFRNCLIELIE